MVSRRGCDVWRVVLAESNGSLACCWCLFVWLGLVWFFLSFFISFLDGRFLVVEYYPTYLYLLSFKRSDLLWLFVCILGTGFQHGRFPSLLAALFGGLRHVKGTKDHVPKRPFSFISHISYFLVAYLEQKRAFYIFQLFAIRPRRV